MGIMTYVYEPTNKCKKRMQKQKNKERYMNIL